MVGAFVAAYFSAVLACAPVFTKTWPEKQEYVKCADAMKVVIKASH